VWRHAVKIVVTGQKTEGKEEATETEREKYERKRKEQNERE
jgi:hypothetical protein